MKLDRCVHSSLKQYFYISKVCDLYCTVQAATGAANAVREGGAGEAGSHDSIAAAAAKGVQAATQGK